MSVAAQLLCGLGVLLLVVVGILPTIGDMWNKKKFEEWKKSRESGGAASAEGSSRA